MYLVSGSNALHDILDIIIGGGGAHDMSSIDCIVHVPTEGFSLLRAAVWSEKGKKSDSTT